MIQSPVFYKTAGGTNNPLSAYTFPGQIVTIKEMEHDADEQMQLEKNKIGFKCSS